MSQVRYLIFAAGSVHTQHSFSQRTLHTRRSSGTTVILLDALHWIKTPAGPGAISHPFHLVTSPVIRIYPGPPFPPPIPQVVSQCLLVCMAHMRSACHPGHWHWCPSSSPQGRVLPGSCRLSQPIPPPAPLCPFVAHQSHGRSCGWVVALLSHACLQ